MKLLIALLVIVVVWLAAVIGIPAYLGMDDLRGCQMAPTTGACASADAIVAISGGDTSARTDEAVSLFQHGWAHMLIFSGAALDKTGPSNARVMQRRAEAAGVPAKDILIDETASDTQENAALSNKIISSHDLKRVILVTSAYHQRRAYLEFQRTAPSGTVIINHPTQNDSLWPKTWWLSISGWWLTLSEFFKTIYVQFGGSL